MRNFNANPMILFSKETDENWQCYCTITRYSWNRRIWKYCDVTIITRVTRVNLRVTRNPHWGYGLGKGSKNSTRTPTRVYPTRDPCGFQNPWQSLMTTTPSTTPPPPVPPSLQPTLKPLNMPKRRRQQQQRLKTRHDSSCWYVFFLFLFFLIILMFILDIYLPMDCHQHVKTVMAATAVTSIGWRFDVCISRAQDATGLKLPVCFLFFIYYTNVF